MPEDLNFPEMHAAVKEAQTIEVSPRVRGDGTHASPTGHFRTGHFRVLRDEKFTHKRFQSVWVRQAWVGSGECETVLSPEQEVK